MPFGFSTHDQQPWVQFAESSEDGPTVTFLSELAKRYNIVIVVSLYERDPQGRYLNWNTVVVISETGRIIGKTHKNHLPKMENGDETIYFHESTLGHPVFETKFGRIGIVICYGRHFPMNWTQLALNGAELIFNPAAITEISEPLWGFEARNAAMTNNCYTFAVNRVGTEVFQKVDGGKTTSVEFGHFFGSNYCAAPDGVRTPGLSRTREGLLITELDLNLCQQASDNWGFKVGFDSFIHLRLIIISTFYQFLDDTPSRSLRSKVYRSIKARLQTTTSSVNSFVLLFSQKITIE